MTIEIQSSKYSSLRIKTTQNIVQQSINYTSKDSNSINVLNLRIILLLDIDINALNKLVYNTEVILELEQNKAISYKKYQ